MTKEKELKSIRFNMVIEPSLIKAIDEFRKSEPDLPSRSEAIRRLLNDKLIGLGYKKPE